MIELAKEICGDLAQANRREWLETNGIGGFASSTITGLNTRRYHGLLTAATQPPVGRLLLLAKLEETVVIDGERFDLAVNQYPGTIHPSGQQYLKSFRLAPFPIFTYEVAGIEIEKSVFMPHGENTTVIQYRANKIGAKNVALEARPLLAFRDYHSTTHENSALNPHVAISDGVATVQPYAALPKLHFAHNACDVATTGEWYRNFEYAQEQARGLEFREDLFQPLVLTFSLAARARAVIIASTEVRDVRDCAAMQRREMKRRRKVLAAASATDDFTRQLVTAADQFIVARGAQKTVIAGYHWFSDWGRDTMIALPGLTLATGRADVAQSILLEFARHVDRGMLPNRFPDAGEAPEYNTVDATLWFFESIRAWAAHTNDYNFVQANFYAVLTDIVDWHIRGTRYGIRVDTDGLLHAGEPGVQLTWMDAKIGDWVVTPRTGKPVEIQALWYNALCIMKDFALRFGDEARASQYAALAARVYSSFQHQFWNEATECLYDVVDDAERDSSLRPNQILALSLPHALITGEKARRVLATVERELLTPVGLRSLAPSDPRYIPHYEGGILERDGAYHQGIVWTWLLGPFFTAYLKVHGNSGRVQVEQWLTAWHARMREAGLGQIAEIYDAEPPFTPRGCIAQAWSVAELLRVKQALAQVAQSARLGA
ncbi:MAG: amylo-alpha-1,6-glucosidase [Blastocatellia bacterium]